MRTSKLEKAYKQHGSNIRDLFTFGAILGRGASSVVRFVTRTLDNENFAMKIVRKDPNAPFLPSLAAEVTVVRSCCHPSIIELIDVYESASRIYLLYPLVPGGSLLDAAARSPGVDERAIATIVAQLADAMGYLHSRSVVHRDLSPSNILVQNPILSTETVVRVADLGHAFYLRHATRTPTEPQEPWPGPSAVTRGTAGYIAPELLAGGDVTPAADVWSLGAILFFLLTGNELSTSTAAAGESLPDLGGSSPAAADLVRRCLDPDPSSRITPAGMLRHPWIANISTSDQQLHGGGGGVALTQGAQRVLAARAAAAAGAAAEGLVSIAAMASISQANMPNELAG